MKSGTRPAQHLYKLKPFEHAFGAADTPTLQPFNVDPGLTMPDQIAEGALTECVGYDAADYLVDVFHKRFLGDFSYAAARHVTGEGPGTNGASFHAGLQGVVAFGGAADADPLGSYYTAAGRGEMYISDWNNWSPKAKTAALKYAQNGVRNVLGSMEPFDAIVTAAYQTGKGITLGSPWFSEFNEKTITDGFKASSSIIWHCYAAKGLDVTLSPGIRKERIAIKSWQGTSVGDNGWLYFDRDTINSLMGVPGAGAITIDPSASRWASLCGIIVQRFPAALPLLSQLLKSNPHP